MTQSIEGTYTFTIEKDEDGYHATLTAPRFEHTWTAAQTEAEMFDMISDCYQCALDIPSNWWNRLLWKLMRYSL